VKDIFIAYSKEQKNNARRLVAKLESSGFSVWIEPRDVLDGSNRKDAVDKAVAGCKAFVILFASTVDKSDELMELVDLAMVHEKTIVPFVVADVTDSVATRYFLGVNNWIDAFEKTISLVDNWLRLHHPQKIRIFKIMHFLKRPDLRKIRILL